MPLDPQAQALLDRLASLDLPDFTTLDPGVVRKLHDVPMDTAEEPVAAVEDLRLAGPDGEIPVRVYTPEGEGPFPALVYFHGGGFVLCNLDTHDATCRRLARRAGCVVVSVDYRLAPEHPYPAAPEDCYAALCRVAERAAELGVDPARLAVGGDSAGGNLAAVVSLMARDRGGPSLRYQLLVYPVTDCAFDTPSYRENAEGYLLSRAMMQWFWGHYLSDPGRAAEPYASPLRAPDLTGLPPAYVLTAEYDPLRDEGEAYADRLHEAGVPVQRVRYDRVIHGFYSMFEAIEVGRGAVDASARALRAALGA